MSVVAAPATVIGGNLEVGCARVPDAWLAEP